MNDYEMMKAMFQRAKKINDKIVWCCVGSNDGQTKAIWLDRHIFTFNKQGQLISSETSSHLLDLD